MVIKGSESFFGGGEDKVLRLALGWRQDLMQRRGAFAMNIGNGRRVRPEKALTFLLLST